MYCIIKCIVQGKQARVKNADLRHPSCTVVMEKRKSVSPVLNVSILTSLVPLGIPSGLFLSGFVVKQSGLIIMQTPTTHLAPTAKSEIA